MAQNYHALSPFHKQHFGKVRHSRPGIYIVEPRTAHAARQSAAQPTSQPAMNTGHGKNHAAQIAMSADAISIAG